MANGNPYAPPGPDDEPDEAKDHWLDIVPHWDRMRRRWIGRRPTPLQWMLLVSLVAYALGMLG